MDLTRRTTPTRPTNANNIPEVSETLLSVNMDSNFPCLHPLSTEYSKDLQLKTHRDVPHQKVINKIVDQLNIKTIHFYNLLFALDILRKDQHKDVFFSDIINYLEDKHLPRLHPLSTEYSKDLQLKTHRDVPHQKVINKIVDQLNIKTIHFYNLMFALDILRKGKRKDAFFSDIINYLEDNHLHTNLKCKNSVIAEAENYLLFNTLRIHFTVKLSKNVEHNMALCIPLELSDGIFELYHSGLMTSH